MAFQIKKNFVKPIIKSAESPIKNPLLCTFLLFEQKRNERFAWSNCLKHCVLLWILNKQMHITKLSYFPNIKYDLFFSTRIKIKKNLYYTDASRLTRFVGRKYKKNFTLLNNWVHFKLTTFCLIWILPILTSKSRSGLTQFKFLWSICDQN